MVRAKSPHVDLDDPILLHLGLVVTTPTRRASTARLMKLTRSTSLAPPPRAQYPAPMLHRRRRTRLKPPRSQAPLCPTRISGTHGVQRRDRSRLGPRQETRSSVLSTWCPTERVRAGGTGGYEILPYAVRQPGIRCRRPSARRLVNGEAERTGEGDRVHAFSAGADNGEAERAPAKGGRGHAVSAGADNGEAERAPAKGGRGHAVSAGSDRRNGGGGVPPPPFVCPSRGSGLEPRGVRPRGAAG